jgi:hypothetical protein
MMAFSISDQGGLSEEGALAWRLAPNRAAIGANKGFLRGRLISSRGGSSRGGDMGGNV